MEEIITIDVEINYPNNSNNSKINLIEGSKEIDTSQSSTQIKLPKSKIKGTFIERELIKNKSSNYIKISFQSKKGMISIDHIIDCFEYINDKNYEFSFNQDNLIPYLFAFTICDIKNLKSIVLEKLLYYLNEEDIPLIIQTINSLNELNLKEYCLYLIKSIINKIYKLQGIKYLTYSFDEIIHYPNAIDILKNPLSSSVNLIFEENKIIHPPSKSKANLNFLREINNSLYEKMKKFYEPNNFFNTGKVIKIKSEESIILANDYPHYFHMTLENDPTLNLYAIRETADSNFIVSCDPKDYTKFGPHYVGEIAANFWGTSFSVYDNGYDDSMKKYIPFGVLNIRKDFGTISYETNILAECPRYFSMKLITKDGTIDNLQNVKPIWSEKMKCYCLNFYGRVKKASAKNFQVIRPEDEDDILLQHGKATIGEYNIDFRDPFSPLFAFALSLVSLGKKRVVS